MACDAACDCGSPNIRLSFGSAIRGGVPIPTSFLAGDDSPYARHPPPCRRALPRCAIAALLVLALCALVYAAAGPLKSYLCGEGPRDAGATFVLYHSERCTHCRRFMPIYDEISARFRGLAKFVKSPPGPMDPSVQYYPTVKFLREGVEVSEHVGASSASDFESFVAACMQ